MSSGSRETENINRSKRPRVSAACTICRKRKVKCDKTRPTCQVCIKHNVAHLCEYIEPNWAANQVKNTSKNTQSPSESPSFYVKPSENAADDSTEGFDIIPSPVGVRTGLQRTNSNITVSSNGNTSEDQIKKLKNKISELEYELKQLKSERIEKEYTSEDETIPLRPKKLKFIPELNSVMSIGVLTPKIFTSIDPLLIFLKTTLPESSLSTLPLEILNIKPIDGTGKENKTVDSQFRSKILEYVSLLASKDKSMKKSDKADFGKSMAPIPIRLGGVGQSYEEDLKIIRFIEERLPSEKVAWLLMDRFFKYVYPFFPYINQDNFYEKVSHNIGQRSDKLTKIKLTVERRYNLINVALFLLVIYLGSLTLYDSIKNPVPEAKTDQDVKFLIEHPIFPKMIVLSQLATKAFHTLAGKSFTLLRVGLYLKIAEQFSPDQAEQLELQSTCGFCFELMVELGMHNDPSNSEFSNNDKILNLLRKVWHGVRCDDFFPSFLVDNYFIKMIDSTTQLPQYLGKSTSGNIDLDIEQATIYGLVERTKFNDIYRKIAIISMDLRQDAYVKDLLELIFLLESLREEKLKPIENLLTPTSPTETFPDRLKKALGFVQYLESGTLLNCLYYHLFLFYENKCKPFLAFKYFKKCISGTSDIGHICSSILTNQQVYFGSGMDYYITPSILYATDALHIMYICVILRMNHYYYLKNICGEMSPEIEELYSGFSDVVSHSFKNRGKIFAKVNSYYYSAWRFNKIEGYRYHKVTKCVREQFNPTKPKNELMPNSSSNVFFKWSFDMFHEVLEAFKTDSSERLTLTSSSSVGNDTKNSGLNATVPSESSSETPLIYSSLDSTWLSKIVDSKMNSMMVNNKDIDFWATNGENPHTDYRPSITPNDNNTSSISTNQLAESNLIQLPNMDEFSMSPSQMNDNNWNNDIKFNQLFDDLNDTLRNSMYNEFQLQ